METYTVIAMDRGGYYPDPLMCTFEAAPWQVADRDTLRDIVQAHMEDQTMHAWPHVEPVMVFEGDPTRRVLKDWRGRSVVGRRTRSGD